MWTPWTGAEPAWTASVCVPSGAVSTLVRTRPIAAKRAASTISWSIGTVCCWPCNSPRPMCTIRICWSRWSTLSSRSADRWANQDGRADGQSVARRQGVCFSAEPSGSAAARHQPAHCSTRYRLERATRPIPVDSRAHSGLGGVVSEACGALRPGLRHGSCLPVPRLCADWPALPGPRRSGPPIEMTSRLAFKPGSSRVGLSGTGGDGAR